MIPTHRKNICWNTDKSLAYVVVTGNKDGWNDRVTPLQIATEVGQKRGLVKVALKHPLVFLDATLVTSKRRLEPSKIRLYYNVHMAISELRS